MSEEINLLDNQIGNVVKLNKLIVLDSIVGQPEAITELKNLLTRILHKDHFASYGLTIPKAIALSGPPGTGKTMSLRALANEANCPLLELVYEDIATHLYDEEIKRLCMLKEQVDNLSKEHGHCLVLIDEADSFFTSRFGSNVHDGDKKKTNFFLRWIDGSLDASEGFTLITTSNAWELCDPALSRNGRFKEIKFKALTYNETLEVLRVHADLYTRSVNRNIFVSDINFGKLNIPPELTGADVKALLEEAISSVAHKSIGVGFNLVEQRDLEIAANKVLGKVTQKRVGFDRD